MNTTQLECFLAVANCLNFSRAAEQLRLTQPAVSHQISTLEDELGVKLFKRTSKSVRLTQEGYLYTQYAGEIMRLFQRLARAAEGGAVGENIGKEEVFGSGMCGRNSGSSGSCSRYCRCFSGERSDCGRHSSGGSGNFCRRKKKGPEK